MDGYGLLGGCNKWSHTYDATELLADTPKRGRMSSSGGTGACERVGHAAKPDACQPAAAVVRHHDQIDVGRGRVAREHLRDGLIVDIRLGWVEHHSDASELRITFIHQATLDAFQVSTLVRFAKRVQLLIDDCYSPQTRRMLAFARWDTVAEGQALIDRLHRRKAA